MMKEFIIWIFAAPNKYANMFTMISVILSGILSWLISAIYYSIGNINNLEVSVLYPISRLLEKNPSRAGYKRLVEYTKDYSMKYLKREERKIVMSLVTAYEAVSNYRYESVCVDSLSSYFKEKLKENGIDLSPIPIYIDGEVVDFDVPVDMLYFDEDIERIVEQYPPEWDTDNCENAVLKIFNIYCKKYYTNKKINFFDDKSLLMVIRTSQYRNKWKEKFNNYRIAKENFLQIKCVERYYLI